jgi:hypothetical protein
VVLPVFRDGKGAGNVLWRLGKDGDMAVHSTDPNPCSGREGRAGPPQISRR